MTLSQYAEVIEAARREWEVLDDNVKAVYEAWAEELGYESGFRFFLAQAFGVWLEALGY